MDCLGSSVQNLAMPLLSQNNHQLTELLVAVRFAAQKHQTQKRKDPDATPYVNHPIAVAEVLGRVGAITDLNILQAALLHDTVEDTATTPEELEEHFEPRVRRLVEEVTDDKRLPQAGARTAANLARAASIATGQANQNCR